MDRALLSILLSSFITPFSQSAIGVALLVLARDLGVPSTGAITFLVVLTLTIAAFVLPFGRLADALGHMRVFKAGLGVVAAGFAAAALSPHASLLYASLIVAGVGLAAVFGSNNALLFQIVPPERRGTAVGLNSTSVYIGLVTGPVAGGYLAQAGWRFVLLPAVVIAIVSYVLIGKAPVSRPRFTSFDIAGPALFAASIITAIVGIDVGAWHVAVLGAAGLALTFVLELNRQDPVVEVRLFRNVVFTASVAAAFLNYLSTAALSPSLSLLFQEAYSMPAREAGMLLSIQAVAMATLAPVAGRLSDKTSPSAVAAAGASLLAASLYAFSQAPAPSTAPLLLFLIGVGFALFIVPNTTLVLSSVPPSRRGMASALVAEARVLGQSVSNAVASYYLKNATSVSAGVTALLALLAYLSLITAFLSLARGLSH